MSRILRKIFNQEPPYLPDAPLTEVEVEVAEKAVQEMKDHLIALRARAALQEHHQYDD